MENNKLSAQLLYRIGLWDHNRSQDESLTQELFEEKFGKVMGAHYYEKWISTYSQNFINMVGYLYSNPTEAQLFCDMVMQKVQQYEQRPKNNN